MVVVVTVVMFKVDPSMVLLTVFPTTVVVEPLVKDSFPIEVVRVEPRYVVMLASTFSGTLSFSNTSSIFSGLNRVPGNPIDTTLRRSTESRQMNPTDPA